VKQIRMNIVPTRNPDHARSRRQTLFDHPCLRSGGPAPPSLRTRQNRNSRHVCPLICKGPFNSEVQQAC
jgi:hypothetical protein